MTKNLRDLRHDTGLTARTAAKRIGVALPTLLDAENGVTDPVIQTKHKIASYYGVQVSEIWPASTRTEKAA
jgi:DNA-binding XRE family transcriptional regulator